MHELEEYCVLPNAKREGPYVKWTSASDAAKGIGGHGSTEVTGAFHDNFEEGAWSIRDSYGSTDRGSFSKGQRVGAWTVFTMSLEQTEQGNYVAGKRDGTWTTTTSGGETFQVSTYRNGKREGRETTTWPSGQKCIESYQDGEREGVGTCWHPNGSKMSVIDWHQGKIVTKKSWDEKGRPQ